MSLAPSAFPLGGPAVHVDDRTRELLERRRQRSRVRRRGWLVHRALLAADVVGLTGAFVIAELIFGTRGGGGTIRPSYELGIFLLTLPAWIVAVKLYELYDHDEENADHTTVDDLKGVFHLVTVGSWLFFLGSWATRTADPNLPKLFTFWAVAIALVVSGRGVARATVRRSVLYLQNTVIIGAGEVGQLVARKLLQHPEFGVNLVGFLDSDPKPLRDDLAGLHVLGSTDRLAELVKTLDIERVVIAFSRATHDEELRLIAALKQMNLQIDIVPRLYEAVGPNVGVHTVESLPLVGLPAAKLFPFSRAIKRTVDVIGAVVGLVLTAPLFAIVAWRIRRDSEGPVFFRQERLGLDQQPFTTLKFRTMKVDTDPAEHEEYIKQIMSAGAAPGENGLYKLDQAHSITKVGGWLRRTSLDELPQLINVLRGDMSLVGPRPCLAYETEQFAPHQFERFLVPAGLTGLWQVTARAHSTFGEALDMDVAYARNWSLGLDLWLILRTPLLMLRKRGTA